MAEWYKVFPRQAGFLLQASNFVKSIAQGKGWFIQIKAWALEPFSLKNRINTILPIALAVLLPGLSLYSNLRLESPYGDNIFLSWFFASVLLYVLWYLEWFLLDPRYGYKLWVGILVLVFYTVFIFGLMLVFVFKGVENIKWFFLARFILGALVFLAIQYALKAQQNISRLMLEKEQMQSETYKAQLKTLRAKVDPHFLFNSLNTLRSMVRQGHSNSEKFVMSLSDFFRQTLKHNENTNLPLSEELAVLESYLFLMKSRSEEAVKVKMNIDSALHGHYLPTLALQVVVENCFKHNSMTSRKPLHIEVFTTESQYIEVRNNIQPRIGEKEPSGYGLEMLRKRYELMKVSDGVIVNETPEHFSVQLKLIRK